MTQSSGPAAVYRQRLDERIRAAAELDRAHLRFGNIRLLVGIAAAAIAWMAFAHHALAPWWLALPIVAFIALAILHERILDRRKMAGRGIQFHERGLARIEDRWIGAGETGDAYRDPAHPYAEDLDLFGKGSLFQLLNAARTEGGELRLAAWLKQAADADTIRARQQAVAELRGRLDLREDLFTLGEDARGKLRSNALVQWAESPRLMLSSEAAALALNALLLAGFAAMQWTRFLTPLLAAAAATVAFGFWLRPRVLAVISHVDDAVNEIDLLRGLLVRLEKETFESPLLKDLSAALRGAGLPASAHIAHLHRLAELIDSRDNVFVRMIGPPLLYSTHLAFAVERWKARSGPQVRRWLEAVSDLEALLSLAAYSYEHPADPFPELTATPIIEGESLGHPLLEASRCVPNPVRLGTRPQLLLVSGSNMSGKSTYLRTVGINVVLAMAGSVVRAGRMRLCPLALGASIRVSDSLQGGSSRFYAEITRLKQIVDLTAAGPSLFLLDEFLHGTNSHDRRIGAEGVLQELVARGAMGIVTTHDLALTAIADAMRERAANCHFEDHLEAGALRFDYRLRDGIVTKSNALELMRSIGLAV